MRYISPPMELFTQNHQIAHGIGNGSHANRSYAKISIVAAMHVGAALAPFYFSYAGLFWFAVMHFLTGCLGMSIGYHRLIAHRSFKAAQSEQNLLAFLGLLNMQGGPITWACLHRAHHAYTNDFGDPHSRTLGFSWAHINWIFSKKPNGFSVIVNARMVRDLMKNRFFRFLEKYDLTINLAFFAVLACFGLDILLWAGCLRVVIVWHSTWLVNSLTHSEKADEAGRSATNIRWLSLITYGEGLHGNHHKRPASPDFGFSPGTSIYDLGYKVIRLAHQVQGLRVKKMMQWCKYLLHAALMPGMRTPIQSNVFKTLQSIATIEHHSVTRAGKAIAVTTLSPIADPDAIQGLVIFCHPLHKSTRSFPLRHQRVQFYLENNYRVVLFDFNGFGDSKFNDFYYSRDAEEVIKFSSDRYSPKKMIIHGISFGSFHMIAALHALPMNSLIIFENTSRSLYDYWKKWWHTKAVITIANRLPFQEVRNMNVQRKASDLKRPDLKGIFMACENDTHTPANEMEDLYRQFHHIQKQFIVFPGSKHLEAPKNCAPAYFSVLKEALEE